VGMVDKMKKIVPITALLTLVGCATPRIEKIADPALVKTIQNGISTQRDVYELFGPPTYHGVRHEAGEWWGYYLPGKDGVTGSSLSLDFQTDGVVTAYLYRGTADRYIPIVEGGEQTKGFFW